MEVCTRSTSDEAIKINELGLQSAYIEVEPPKVSTGKTVGIIGGGVAGLSAAWQLAQLGNRVEKLGVKFVTICKVDAVKFKEICDTSDAVLIAVAREGHKKFRD